MTVYKLTIEDATSLGSMGSDTTFDGVEIFATLEAAQKFAETYKSARPRNLKWEKYGERWAIDGITHVFSIEAVEVKE